MLGILLIFIVAVYLFAFYPIFKPKTAAVEEKNPKYAQQMKKLWSVAQDSMRERKPLRAEKALLTILKFDEKNAAAYNRLGILYAKEQKYDEAIECFEIAQSLDNNASSLHNVGLIYLETGAYEKAEMAFKQAIDLEGDVPARFMALAKVYENLGKKKDALENLENAYSLSPTLATLNQILAIHEEAEDQEAITATKARIEKLRAEKAKTTTTRRRGLRTRAPRVARVARPARPVRPRMRPTRTGVKSSAAHAAARSVARTTARSSARTARSPIARTTKTHSVSIGNVKNQQSKRRSISIDNIKPTE